MTHTHLAISLVLSLSLLACGDVDVGSERPAAPPLSLAESLDDPSSVDVASWNVEWFGDLDRGPWNERRQLDNAALVLGAMDVELVGLVEIVSPASFGALVEALPGYTGLLVTDELVAGGADSYADGEQKVALIMRDRFRVTSARVILADQSWTVAGRPPMEVSLEFYERGRRRTLDVVVAHFKAMANEDGWERRAQAATALQAWLAAEHPSDWCLVVGDFNDDLDESTYRGAASPFAALVDDPRVRFTTAALTASGASTTVGFSATIDHHLATASLAERFVDGSALVVPADEWVDDYGNTTSDHFPVLTRYRL